MRLAATCVILAASSACSSFDPQVGAQLAAQCVDEDGDPDAPVTYVADILPILMDRCFGCHTPGGRSPIGLEIGGLDMSTYSSLRAGGVVSGDRIVIPGSPCRSLLVDKIEEYPSFGGRMPLTGPPFLDDAQIELIADWIAEGARVE
jgi:mono/diheme cytochrome c family protein